MAYLQSNIPHFKCWVRREYTCNHEKYHGEFLHGIAIAVTTMPNRCLSFQIIFSGGEADNTDEENVHGGAMWARMPITALVADTPVEEWATPMPVHYANRGIVPPLTTQCMFWTGLHHVLGWQKLVINFFLLNMCLL